MGRGKVISEEEVLGFISSYKQENLDISPSQDEVAEGLGISKATASRRINELIEKGRLLCIGKGRRGLVIVPGFPETQEPSHARAKESSNVVLSEKRKDSIAKRAKEKLHFTLHLPTYDQIPVPLVQIAEESLGFSVRKRLFPSDLDGILFGKEREIWINSFYDTETNKLGLSPRQRFTLAHEIGHITLHLRPGSAVVFEERVGMKLSEKKERIEREASFFAAQLLMPGSAFLEITNDYIHKLSEEGRLSRESVLGMISGKFKVSIEAADRRLDEFFVFRHSLPKSER